MNIKPGEASKKLIEFLEAIRSSAGNASDGVFNAADLDEAIRLAKISAGQDVPESQTEVEQRPLPFYLAPVVIPMTRNADTRGNLQWVEPEHLIEVTRDPKWEKVVGKDFQRIEDYWEMVESGEAEPQFRIIHRDSIAKIEDSKLQRFLSIYQGVTAIFYVTEWTEEPLL